MGYANPSPTYQPAMRIITAISNSKPASVTTSFAHNYITGTIVRLYVPLGFGMTQANQLFSSIIVTSPTTFTMDIDTINFDQFVIPAGPTEGQSAEVVPIGEISEILTAATHNVLNFVS